MPIDKELLEILCCPETYKELKMLPAEKIAQLNAQIAASKVKYADGALVEEPLQEGLITIDDTIIYRIDDDIPVMLVEKAIPTEQLAF